VSAVSSPSTADPSAIRVLVVDDHDGMRFGLQRLLASADGIDVCGTAEDGAAATVIANELVPDVVLIDLSMPVLDGIGATRAILRDHLATCVLVLTSYSREAMVRGAMAAGAAGYLLKGCPPDVLVESVREVFRGEHPVTPWVRSFL
jgi:DNA-binding NarL/FixJ family response regulator